MNIKSDKRLKPHVSVEFTMPTGDTAQRSRLDDFNTLRGRIYLRIRECVGDYIGNLLVMPAVNVYNNGDYEEALTLMTLAIREFPALLPDLEPHMRICRRVILSSASSKDNDYLDMVKKWASKSWLARRLKTSPTPKVRCKYCGHFTPYIHPELGFAYLGTNNCQGCDRGYPAPDFIWDGIDGQAYIYYRHSVKEQEFYREFESQYNVHPDHTYFLSNNEGPGSECSFE